ncbi:MAG: SLC13 family permease [Gammaproteobacteria bacterium]|nr:SLC13 family permease [Gammaproteobacteria bacterium]
MNGIQKIGLILAVCLPVSILLFGEFGSNPKIPAMAAVATMMALLWVTEAIPLSATALLPLVLFPLLGITTTKAVATTYMNTTVFLLLGGFLIAHAMQRWNLHRRIALLVLTAFGSHPVQLLAGFVVATAGLSMWINNTSTTLVMMPIALAILSRFHNVLSESQVNRLTTGFLLAIAYSASIGGMMTPVGTAPNLVFMRLYEMTQADGQGVSFTEWMLMTIPIGCLLLLIQLIYLSHRYCRGIQGNNSISGFIKEEKLKLGSIRFEEIMIAVIFSITALLWITRKKIQTGWFHFSGWQSWVPNGTLMDDTTVAVAMALLLFLIPGRAADGSRTRLLDSSVFQQLPWAVVVLFGGGFALASGFVESGLSVYIGEQVASVSEISIGAQMFIVTAVMTALTELTSNTATTQLILPILRSVAESTAIAPQWLMMPATLAASCAFMFPVATPPNAIVFSSGKITIGEMLRAGLIINIMAVIVIALLLQWLLPAVLGA